MEAKTMASQQQTIEQQRAARAWQCIEEVKRQDNEAKKKYSTQARKFPSLIQVNGLGQALAFVYSKAKFQERNRGAEARANGLLFNQVSNWVKGELKVSGDENLLRLVVGQKSDFYRRATTEAIAFLNWLKRFAEAELPTEEGGGGE
jgi:CRISPR-associated protein Cmr5